MNPNKCNGMIYTMEAGDTLYSVSRKFGVPLALILRGNPAMDIYNVKIGEEICIPGFFPGESCPMDPGITYVVKEGDTLGGVLTMAGISLEDLLGKNPAEEIRLLPGNVLRLPHSGESKV